MPVTNNQICQENVSISAKISPPTTNQKICRSMEPVKFKSKNSEIEWVEPYDNNKLDEISSVSSIETSKLTLRHKINKISDIVIINILNRFVFFLFLIFILSLNFFGLYIFPYYLKQPMSIDD